MTCLPTKNAVPHFLESSLKARLPALVGHDCPSLGQMY